jgi:hypothetical protein
LDMVLARPTAGPGMEAEIEDRREGEFLRGLFGMQ